MKLLVAIGHMLTENGRVLSTRSPHYWLEYEDVVNKRRSIFVPPERFDDDAVIGWRCPQCAGEGKINFDVELGIIPLQNCPTCKGCGRIWEDQY